MKMEEGGQRKHKVTGNGLFIGSGKNGLVRKVTNVTNYNSQQCMELLLLVPTNNNLHP